MCNEIQPPFPIECHTQTEYTSFGCLLPELYIHVQYVKGNTSVC